MQHFKIVSALQCVLKTFLVSNVQFILKIVKVYDV